MLGRTDELNILDRLYSANSLQIAVLEGAAGIGKTVLLKEFLKRKRKYYFAVRDAIDSVNQQAFLEEGALQGLAKNCSAGSWQDVLENICKTATGEKLALVIDNAQLLEASFASFWPAFLSLLSNYRAKLRLSVIFSGSGLEALERNLREYKELLTHIKLQPLTFHEALAYFADMDNEDKVLLYGVTGGQPAYLQQIDAAASVKENLFKLFYRENGELTYLGEERLAQHLRQPHIYHAILFAVAKGALRMKEIAAAIGMEDNKASKYIDSLVRLGWLKRMVPLNEACTGKQCKNTCYLFADNMLFFWYLFVYPYISAIEMGLGNTLLRTKVLPELQGYIEKIFLDICCQHCWKLKARGNFSIDFERLGFIWPRGGTLKDFRLAAYGSREACYMQCCWSKAKVDLDAIIKLQQDYGGGGAANHYLIFSRKGFTDRALTSDIRLQNVRLISLHYFK